MDVQFAALIPAVYVIVEGLEWLGCPRRIAHLLGLPIGILVSFLIIPGNALGEKIVYGLLIGLGAAGTCDTVGNCRRVLRRSRKSTRPGKK
jgi:hypothetical protein